MKTFETNIKASDGTDFHVQGWKPDGKPKALIALIHGIGEHTGRYEHVAQAMTDAGYAMVGYDLRGHGRSGGIRGHFPSLDAVMQDMKDFLVFVTTQYPDIPHFLYGHSLGGLLVLTYALKNKPAFNGVIATGSGLRSSVHEQKAKVALAKILGSLFPTTLMPSGLDVNGLSHDENVIKKYNADPLVHDRMSLGFGKAGLNATDYVWSHAEEFPMPLLLMHGTGDQITYSHGSVDFARLAEKNNKDVTLKLWDGLYHELHNEPEKEQVIRFMIDWLNGHL
jgi:acylglycerol lipase